MNNSSTCSVGACRKRVDSREMCQAHYKRWKATGVAERPCLGCGDDLTVLSVGSASYCGDQCKPDCRIDGCTKLVYAKHKVCRVHLNGIRRNGGVDPKAYVPAERVCVVCGAKDWPPNWLRSYCSKRCAALHSRAGGRVPRTMDCVFCGREFDLFDVSPRSGRKKRNDAGCCTACSRPRNAMTATELSERDGRACSICGEDVAMEADWPDEFSPSVDHVVPYFLGGENTPSNCALTHLVCNLRKNKSIAVAVG